MTTTDTLPSKRQPRSGTQPPRPARPERGNRQRANDERPVTKSLQEYGRGIAGGILFSLPLLYTMEVWWAGFSIHPWHLAAAVVMTLVLLLGYNRYAGLRSDAGMLEVLIDSIEELGIGLVIATTVLWLLGRIRPDMPISEIAGKIIVESLIVAIGVSVGTAQLGGGEGDGESESESDTGMDSSNDASSSASPEQTAGDPNSFAGQLVLSFCGAILIAANVAPTEEIIMLAVEIESWRLLGLAFFSIILSALILHYSDFQSTQSLDPTHGFFGVFCSTIITYAVALISSAMLLWFFGSFDGFALITCLAETIVLGVAAVLGASAGRLLLQANS
ncbi:MAG: TIGR02587 family membrane protein [Chloroflexota bacterium]|nr:TIGR02587 family membrane protein [Chloroflexota bacterium]